MKGVVLRVKHAASPVNRCLHKAVVCAGNHKMMNLIRRLARFIRMVWIASRKEKRGRTDWFSQLMTEKKLTKRLKLILKRDYHTQKDMRRAEHMADLEQKVNRLKSEVTCMRESAERHNIGAYATGLIVRCTGCETGQPFEGNDLTEDRVKMVERISGRLRTWFINHQYRAEAGKP